jgi:IS1 family transposase
MDELWHYLNHRPRTETRENVYVIPLISREPRQIVSIMASRTKTAVDFQRVVDNTTYFYQCNTDGNFTYQDVIFPGHLKQNFWNKSDTHNVESVNADFRDYIRGLFRRCRCFFRSLETLNAVLFVFANAYNKFGEAKLLHRRRLIRQYGIGAKLWNHYKDPPINLFQFVSV